MFTWLTHHKVIATGLAGLGAYVIYRHGKNTGAAEASQSTDTSYQGPSSIGAPGPAVSIPGATSDTGSSSNPSTTPFDIASYIQGQIELGRQNSNVATQTNQSTVNADVLGSFLDRLNPKKYLGTQFNVGYDPTTGAVSHLDITKALDPVDAAKSAMITAKANATQRKDALAAIKQGFQPPNWDKYTSAVQVKSALNDWLANVAAYKKSGGAIGQAPSTKTTGDQKLNAGAGKTAIPA